MLATDMTASGTTRRTPHRFMQIHKNIYIKEFMLATDMTASGTPEELPIDSYRDTFQYKY